MLIDYMLCQYWEALKMNAHPVVRKTVRVTTLLPF